jgi:hypothetical protein
MAAYGEFGLAAVKLIPMSGNEIRRLLAALVLTPQPA